MSDWSDKRESESSATVIEAIDRLRLRLSELLTDGEYEPIGEVLGHRLSSIEDRLDELVKQLYDVDLAIRDGSGS